MSKRAFHVLLIVAINHCGIRLLYWKFWTNLLHNVLLNPYKKAALNQMKRLESYHSSLQVQLALPQLQNDSHGPISIEI